MYCSGGCNTSWCLEWNQQRRTTVFQTSHAQLIMNCRRLHLRTPRVYPFLSFLNRQIRPLLAFVVLDCKRPDSKPKNEGHQSPLLTFSGKKVMAMIKNTSCALKTKIVGRLAIMGWTRLLNFWLRFFFKAPTDSLPATLLIMISTLNKLAAAYHVASLSLERANGTELMSIWLITP